MYENKEYIRKVHGMSVRGKRGMNHDESRRGWLVLFAFIIFYFLSTSESREQPKPHSFPHYAVNVQASGYLSWINTDLKAGKDKRNPTSYVQKIRFVQSTLCLLEKLHQFSCSVALLHTSDWGLWLKATLAFVSTTHSDWTVNSEVAL